MGNYYILKTSMIARCHCRKRTAVLSGFAGGFLLLLAACSPQPKQPRIAIPVASPPARTLAVPAAESASLPKTAFPVTQAPPAAAPHLPTSSPLVAILAASRRDYRDGVAFYQAGALDSARRKFNRAIDRLLTAPAPAAAAPALHAALRHWQDRIHALEMQALVAGDGFSAQPPRPAPIDRIAPLTFPLTPAIRAEVEKQIRDRRGDMPLELRGPVIRYIHYFTTHDRAYLIHSFERAGRYRAMIETIFHREGIPQDLIYLAQAESGFHVRAVSYAGARGMWQFMADRGEEYGLRRNWWVDERQDPLLSTIAAARHLKDLHRRFGDWYLAMAAYNSGPETVLQAVARTGYADFWQLYRRDVLPQQTRNYVPIILAIALIAKNPAAYGLTHLRPDPPLAMSTVRLNAPVDLRLAAECADTSVAVLRQLNPDLLRLTTPNLPNFAFHLPVDSKARFLAALDRIPASKRVLWRYHRVRAGETLAGVARRYHVSLASLAAVNARIPGRVLPAGLRLVIPIRRWQTTLAEGIYRVRSGDSLYWIARRFHLRVAQLRRWNHISGSDLQIGQRIWLHPRLVAARRAIHPRWRGGQPFYRVRPGDSLSLVAQRAGCTVAQLRAWNGLHGTLLRVGERLRVRGVASPRLSPAHARYRQAVRLRPGAFFTIRVRAGDSLSRIAQRYHVTIRQIQLWNHLHGSLLRIGQMLRLARRQAG